MSNMKKNETKRYEAPLSVPVSIETQGFLCQSNNVLGTETYLLGSDLDSDYSLWEEGI